MMVLAMVMVMVVKLGGGRVVLGWMARLMRTRL